MLTSLQLEAGEPLPGWLKPDPKLAALAIDKMLRLLGLER